MLRPLAVFILLGAQALAQAPQRETAGATFVLRGRVVAEPRGTAVRGATVIADGQNVSAAPAFTDTRGEFQMQVTARGRVDLRVAKAGFARELLSIEATQRTEPIEITLVRAGAVAGRVQDGLGQAYPDIRVRIRPSDPAADTSGGSGIGAVTDDLGEFRAGGLRPGRYLVTVQSSDEIPANMTTEQSLSAIAVPKSAVPPEQTIEVRGGEDARVLFDVATLDPARRLMVSASGTPGSPAVQATKVTLSSSFRTATRGVITGRLVDRYGDPVEGALVQPMTLAFAASGAYRVEVVPTKARETNDKGEFRLFGISPGSYLLAARVPGPDAGALSLYPGGGGFDQAARVRLEDGQDLAGIEMTFAPAQPGRVRGSVVNATGRTGLTGSVGATARAAAGPFYIGATARIAEDGTVELPGMLPGTYSLYAFGRGESEFTELGVAEVTVGSDDVDSVVIATSRGTRVAGTIAFEGTGTAAPRTAGLGIAATDPAYANSVYTGGFIRDGRFEMTGVMGPGLLTLEGAPADWWLKSVLIDGRDVVDTPVTFGLEDYDDVQVTVGIGGGRVDGTVTTEGQVAFGTTVVIFPTDRSRWFYRSRHLRLASAVGTRFSVAGLPPGDYVAAAIDASIGERYYADWQHSDFLDALVPVAQPVTVRNGERASVNLRVRRSGR